MNLQQSESESKNDGRFVAATRFQRPNKPYPRPKNRCLQHTAHGLHDLPAKGLYNEEGQRNSSRQHECQVPG
jgi:hypothetical protein